MTLGDRLADGITARPERRPAAVLIYGIAAVGVLGPDGFDYAIQVTLDGDKALPLGHAESVLDVYEETFDPSVLSSSTRATRADGVVLTRSGLAAGETVDVVRWATLE